jgi:flagellar biosynthesis protein FliR
MPLLSALQTILNGVGVHVEVERTLLIFGLIFGRVTAALALAPFLGGPSVPSQIKIGLSAVIAAVLLPALSREGTVPLSVLTYCALLAKELVVGSVIGLLTQIVFYGIQLAGILIDTQRGMNQVTYLAPQLPGNVSVLGNLKFQAGLVIFLALEGHLIFIRALATSFSALPPLTMPRMHAGWIPVAEQAISITSRTILIGFEMAAPIILAIFLVDLSFGCIGRVASQIRISNDSNTAKSWLGLALFFVAAAVLLGLLPGFFAGMIRSISELTRSLN